MSGSVRLRMPGQGVASQHLRRQEPALVSCEEGFFGEISDLPFNGQRPLTHAVQQVGRVALSYAPQGHSLASDKAIINDAVRNFLNDASDVNLSTKSAMSQLQRVWVTQQDVCALKLQSNKYDVPSNLNQVMLDMPLLEKRNRTPLHEAVLDAKPVLVSFLLGQGANTNTLAQFNYTPFHFAATSNDIIAKQEILALLLAYDARNALSEGTFGLHNPLQQTIIQGSATPVSLNQNSTSPANWPKVFERAQGILEILIQDCEGEEYKEQARKTLRDWSPPEIKSDEDSLVLSVPIPPSAATPSLCEHLTYGEPRFGTTCEPLMPLRPRRLPPGGLTLAFREPRFT